MKKIYLLVKTMNEAFGCEIIHENINAYFSYADAKEAFEKMTTKDNVARQLGVGQFSQVKNTCDDLPNRKDYKIFKWYHTESGVKMFSHFYIESVDIQ